MDEQNTNTPPGNFIEAYAAGTQQQIQTECGDVPVIIVPESMRLHTLEDLVEKQRERPSRIAETTQLLSANSFIEYYNRFATKDSTIFVDAEDARFTAVFDYHQSTQAPGWGRHRAVYTCPRTKEWSGWLKNDNAKMDQQTFALFIEDNLNEIAEPSGAEMLEIATTLKAKTDVDFQSNVRLDNGQVQFTYRENIDGQAGVAGQLTIPEKITLNIRPFLSGAPYVMEARFRYRVTQGGLAMWYTLIRPHLVQEHAVNEVIETVRNNMGTGQLLEAKAP